MNKSYRRIKEGWEKPLEKKRLRRERKAIEKAQQVLTLKLLDRIRNRPLLSQK